MARPNIRMLRIYKTAPGDAGVKDIPIFSEQEELKTAAMKWLLDHHKDPKRGFKRATICDVVEEDGTISVKYAVRGPDTVVAVPI